LKNTAGRQYAEAMDMGGWRKTVCPQTTECESAVWHW
jgi:hypothetical protein